MITVNLNDKPHEVEQVTTLKMFMTNLSIPLEGIAIAIDYEVIPKTKWDEIMLTNGMSMIMIQAVSGG